MNKITIYLLFLLTFNSFSQVTKVKSIERNVIGEARYFGDVVATMYKISGDPDYYLIAYEDQSYRTPSLRDLKSFGFYDIDGAFDTLYNSILDGYRNKIKQFRLNVDKGIITIRYRMGGVLDFKYTDENGISSITGDITRKNFSKLFGKKFNRKDFEKKE